MTFQRITWGTMTFSAMLLAAYASSLLLLPAMRELLLQQIFVSTPIAIATHIGGSVVVLVTQSTGSAVDSKDTGAQEARGTGPNRRSQQIVC